MVIIQSLFLVLDMDMEVRSSGLDLCFVEESERYLFAFLGESPSPLLPFHQETLPLWSFYLACASLQSGFQYVFSLPNNHLNIFISVC